MSYLELAELGRSLGIPECEQLMDFVKEQQDIQRSERAERLKEDKEMDNRKAAAEKEREDRKATAKKQREAVIRKGAGREKSRNRTRESHS